MEYETIGGHRISPLARIFPPYSRRDLLNLTNDIGEQGQREAIVRHRGLVIDGLHRLLVCQALEIEPWIKDLEDEADPKAFVFSANYHRRHLTRNQRLVLAFHLSEQSTPGRPSDKDEPPAFTIGEAAKICQVPRRSVEQVRRVLREQSPAVHDLKAAVLAYDVTPSDAEKIIDRPPDVQLRSLSLKQSGRFRTVTAAARDVEEEIRQNEDAASAQALLGLCLDDTVTLLNSTVSNLSRLVEAESADLILSFPPTEKWHLDLFSDLADFAVHALSQEGLMALLVSAGLLPEILPQMQRDDLRFLIEFDYRFPGRASRLPHPHRSTVHRQPLLIYGKRRSSLPPGPNFIEEPDAGDPSRLLELGMERVVERLVRPGGTVCDPLILGRAGIAMAARRHGCRFTGASDNVRLTQKVKDRLDSEEARSKGAGGGEESPEAD